MNGTASAPQGGDGHGEGHEDQLADFYRQVHAKARQLMAREPTSSSLGPTDLVQEAYVRVGPHSEVGLPYYVAAMRSLLVDRARAKRTMKRDPGGQRVPLEDPAHRPPDPDVVLDVDEKLRELERERPLEARVLEMVYFGQLEYASVAEALGVSKSTVQTRLEHALRWMRRRLDRDVFLA